MYILFDKFYIISLFEYINIYRLQYLEKYNYSKTHLSKQTDHIQTDVCKYFQEEKRKR